MEGKRKLPVGIENFEEIRTEGFYYVDKTGLIKALLNNWGKVNLFTRPRRFGKSLNMNMLKTFFEYGCDARLFEGLEIARESELCRKYMGNFPVISITLKGVNARSYETARGMLSSIIGEEAMRFQFLQKSEKLSEEEKIRYKQLLCIGTGGQPSFIMSDEVLMGSLRFLSQLLQKHYGQKVILLIDEYDVPLDKAQNMGYYDDMVVLLQNLLSQALKSNDSLYFAVLTGCLRIAKESIFTGLNNLQVFSITDISFDEFFGFSDREVRKMLEYYGFEDQYGLVKMWYDGYQFGNAEIYCPWDVINYCARRRSEPGALPRAFWANSSGNDIIKKFLEQAKQRTRSELEQLVNGESIVRKINQELTYRELYKNIDNLWSVLLTTGYLTQCRKVGEDIYELKIPNYEIQQIFIDHILEWIQEEAHRDISKLDAFCDAFEKADAETVEMQFNAYLQKTISIRDTSVRKAKKENFYHGILLGLLSHREEWDIDSNAESGEGYSDILIEIAGKNIGIVIEVKYPDDGDLEKGCQEALEQIEKMKYETRLRQDGMRTIFQYGIACSKKSCRVQLKMKPENKKTEHGNR